MKQKSIWFKESIKRQPWNVTGFGLSSYPGLSNISFCIWIRIMYLLASLVNYGVLLWIHFYKSLEQWANLTTQKTTFSNLIRQLTPNRYICKLLPTWQMIFDVELFTWHLRNTNMKVFQQKQQKKTKIYSWLSVKHNDRLYHNTATFYQT